MFLSTKEKADIKQIIKKSGVKTNSDNAEYVLFQIIKKLLSEIEVMKKKIKDIEN